MSTSSRLSWSRILLSLAVVLGVIGISGALYLREAGEIEKNLRDRESRRVEIFAHLFEKDFCSVCVDLRLLADGDGLHAYLLSGQQAELERAIHRAVFFSREELDNDKIR